MRQMIWQQVGIDGHWVEREDTATQTRGLSKKLWEYGWGLLFVLAMTLLSEFGPRTVYSKLPPAPQVVSQPGVPSVK